MPAKKWTEELLEFDVGQHALDLERHLKRVMPICDTGIVGFRTESVLDIHGTLLLNEIDRFLSGRLTKHIRFRYTTILHKGEMNVSYRISSKESSTD